MIEHLCLQLFENNIFVPHQGAVDHHLIGFLHQRAWPRENDFHRHFHNLVNSIGLLQASKNIGISFILEGFSRFRGCGEVRIAAVGHGIAVPLALRYRQAIKN
jgi:hypothetical protein